MNDTPEVLQYDESFGAFQFEVEFEAGDATTVERVRLKVANSLGTDLRNCELIEVLEHIYYSGFPFR